MRYRVEIGLVDGCYQFSDIYELNELTKNEMEFQLKHMLTESDYYPPLAVCFLFNKDRKYFNNRLVTSLRLIEYREA